MPKVTLLGNPGKTYIYYQGKGEFSFSSGVPADVPVAVALELQKLKGKKGHPLFLVEEMPSIVSPAEKAPGPSGQNVAGKPRQRRFETWPSSQP
jgi:hypothetical protein